MNLVPTVLAHSLWSASGFAQKIACPGSHVLQAGKPNTSSIYAAEGTAAHQVLTWALQFNTQASAFIGCYIGVDGFTVDAAMATGENSPGETLKPRSTALWVIALCHFAGIVPVFAQCWTVLCFVPRASARADCPPNLAITFCAAFMS